MKDEAEIVEAFDDIAGAAWAASPRTPLEGIYDALYPGWDDDKPAEFATVSLLDAAGLPFCCSACGCSHLWAWNGHRWRCAGEHEPVWVGRGYIEQVIEVGAGEVVIESH